MYIKHLVRKFAVLRLYWCSSSALDSSVLTKPQLLVKGSSLVPQVVASQLTQTPTERGFSGTN